MLKKFRSRRDDMPDGELRRVVRNDVFTMLPLAVLLVLEIYVPLLGGGVDRPALATLCGLVGVLPLAARRVAPVAALVAVMAGALLSSVVYPDFKSFSQFLVWVFAAYSVGAHEPNDRALWGLIAALAGTGLLGVSGGLQSQSDTFSVWIFLGTGWVAGRAIRRRETATDDARARAERLAVEKEQQAGLAVAQERSRIARELHDVVAHNVSVMVVQAGAAQRVIEGDPARARDALSSIETVGRQALVELRRLLGVLRADDGSHGVAPQPGLAQVDELIARARAAGIDAGIKVEGQQRALSMGADLAAYRIVQEALTNVIKHASATAVDVTVRYLPQAVELAVSDNGTGRNAAGLTEGHGLIGMRERVAMFGGTLSAVQTREGGFAVSAHIPLDAEVS
ncbi:MAG: sensor histidine kinase [Chloroflexi bacterium]|nr:sensor histidine kinase [Chloroflexota bacterium]